MASALTASQFLGNTVATSRTQSRAGARQSVRVNAGVLDSIPLLSRGRGEKGLSKKDKNTIKRGEKGEVKKAGKLLPKDPKKMDSKPERARVMFNARNLRRGAGGGAGGGAPWQKINPNTPGYRGIPKTIDPIIFVGGLIATYVAIQVGLTATSL